MLFDWRVPRRRRLFWRRSPPPSVVVAAAGHANDILWLGGAAGAYRRRAISRRVKIQIRAGRQADGRAGDDETRQRRRRRKRQCWFFECARRLRQQRPTARGVEKTATRLRGRRQQVAIEGRAMRRPVRCCGAAVIMMLLIDGDSSMTSGHW